ncbi:MAG: hypothetical protein ABIB72_02280 [Candidatus Falkowbacteria bacterium]
MAKRKEANGGRGKEKYPGRDMTRGCVNIHGSGFKRRYASREKRGHGRAPKGSRERKKGV